MATLAEARLLFQEIKFCKNGAETQFGLFVGAEQEYFHKGRVS